jgi:hypothetical protein
MRAKVVLSLVAMMLAGCSSSTPVRIVMSPGQSQGIATQILSDGTEGRTYSYVGPVTDLSLPSDEATKSYRFESTSDVEGFIDSTTEMTLGEILGRPKVAGNRHEIVLELEDEFVLDEQLVTQYDPERMDFVARYRLVRAWRDVAGDGQAAVGRVYKGLEAGAGIRGMAIAPNGNRLAFSEAVPRDGQTGAVQPQANNIVKLDRCTIRAIDVVTSSGAPRSRGVSRVRQGDYRDLDPCFSGDSSEILFATNRRRPNSADLAVVSSIGHQGGIGYPPNIASEGETILYPSASSDGSIAYMLFRRGRALPQIWCRPPQSYPTYIADGSHPRISPDGKRIAYIGDDRNLWIVNSDGTDPKQYTSNAEDLLEQYYESLSGEERERFDPELFAPYSFPTWSADGNRLVYTSMDGTDSTQRLNDDIWMLDTVTGESRQLTYNGSIDSNPVLSPDDRYVYFVSNRGNEWAIWALEIRSGG